MNMKVEKVYFNISSNFSLRLNVQTKVDTFTIFEKCLSKLNEEDDKKLSFDEFENQLKKVIKTDANALINLKNDNTTIREIANLKISLFPHENIECEIDFNAMSSLTKHACELL